MNTIKMFWMMLIGLFHMKDFEDREDFWAWYWGRIPNAKYPGETLYYLWDTFKWRVTLGPILFEVGMWFKYHFGKKHFGYSWTFSKNGYFFKRGDCWWFSPTDGSFTYGRPYETIEQINENPLFI